MTEILRARRGIPKFARKVLAGAPVRIVAFGTSLTLHSHCGQRLGARYLDPLVPMAASATRNARIELIAQGLEGFPSWWAAHRVRSDVLPHAPDLVLLEFAHNDTYVPAIPAAMHAIVDKIREALPTSEIAIVILAPQGSAARGPSETMLAHERVAEYYGLPSFDLATFAERLVADGRTTWAQLTFDGIHHTELATQLLGEPFARAFVELLRVSAQNAVERAPVAPARSPIARADRASMRQVVGGDRKWTVGPPSPQMLKSRTIAAFVDEIATANEAGASFSFAFRGMHVQVWALSLGGALEVAVDGAPAQRIDVPASAQPYWGLVSLATDMPDALHAVEIAVTQLPIVLGDLFFVGELEPAAVR